MGDTASGPRVLNKKRDGVPEGAVYVGRPTKWGNPYKMGEHGTRHDVVRLYRLLARDRGAEFIEQVQDELAGRDLVCWCAPHECHADVLLEIANAE